MVVEEPTEGPETEDGEPAEGDDVTPVTEPSDGQNDEAEEEGASAENESTDETESDDVSDSNLEEDEAEVSDSAQNQIKAMETAEDVTITLKQPVFDSDGVTVKSYVDLKDAVISYSDNCADNKTNAVNKDAEYIKFKVTPVDGKKVTNVGYALATQNDEFAAPASLASNPTANQEFMISESVSALAAAKLRVMIVVTTADVEYAVNISKGTGAANTAQISFVKTDNAYGSFSVATATNEASSVTYNGSLSFAVKGLGLDAKKVIVTANKSGGAADDAITLSGIVYKNGTLDDDSDDVLEYTLRASDVKKLNKKDNDTITVSISKPGEKSLTLKDASFTTGIDVDTTHLEVGTVAGLGSEYENLDTSSATVAYTVDKKIAFTTTLKTIYEDEYNIIKPVAQWADDKDATAKKDLPVTSEKKGDVTYWAIDLSSVTADGYLWITIKAEPDETKPNVKTISFAGSNVKAAVDPDADGTGTITAGNNLVGKSVKTTDDDYAFVVEPDAGYVITKIETTINKVYTSGTPATASETIMINKNGEKYTEEDEGLYVAFVDKEGFKLPLTGRDKLENGDSRPWTAKTISVNITTEEQKTDVNIPIIFSVDNDYNSTDKGVYGYTVNTADGLVTKAATVDPDNGYLVKKGASSLEFTVTGVGEVAPAITINGAAYDGKAVSGSTYKISVGKLDASKTNTIAIVRQKKNVTVKYAAAGSVVATVKDADADTTRSLSAETVVAGVQTRTVTVNADAMTVIEISNASGKKADISSVTYWFGENGTKQTAEKNSDGTYTIETKLKDDLTVEVKKSEEKQLKVAYKDVAGTIAQNEAGVYLVEKYEEFVKAEIFGGEDALVLYSAVVKDGDKNAKTKATIDTVNASKSVNIKVDKTERGKDLKVEIVTLEDRTPVEFVLRADEAVEEISYVGISDGKVSLPVDSEVKAKIDLPDGIKAQNLNVLLLAGNADVPASITPGSMTSAPAVDGVAGRSVTDSTNVTVTLYDDGRLAINALANSTGAAVADAAKIVLYDNRATGDNCVALKGSEVKIDIEQATVKANALSAPVVSTTAKEIILNVTLPDGVVTPKTGKLYYKVSVTAPTSGYDTKEVNGKTYTGIESAVATWAAGSKYFFVDDVKRDGGFIKLEPFARVAAVDGVAFPGMALEGFEVEVSLAQTYASSVVADDANTIVGEGMKAAAALQAPSYANTETGKLNLKKENYGTLYTGNTAWVAVATPDFGKSAAAYTAVETKMVDMKTGEEFSDWNGMWSRYNSATGKVEVHFASTASWYMKNAAGNYKDIGVKVIAKTEDTGYALAGTMKLTVANGIESINATAQPRVLKNDKATSFKVNVVFNDEGTDKKYAPKSKNVTYTIVGNDSMDINNLVPAPAKIAAAVTSKNGTSPTINIDKNYAVTGTAAENTFKILVTAKDYAGNETYDLTESILITSESAPLGELVVMKKGTDWNDATLVSGAVEATKERDEFKAVVLKPGVGKDRATYNLDEVAVDTAWVNFAPAKGNISIAANGDITIKKLGKANLSATDKSNKKNVSKCAVEFVEKNTTMALRLTQLKDSTLETAGKVSYDRSITFSGRNTTFFGVDIVDDKDKDKSEIKLSNAKVKFGKNLKNVTPKENNTGYQYVIAMTGADAVITLQPKSGAAADYTLKNEAYVNNKKAPKVALENKAQKFTQDNLSDTTYVLTSAVKGEKFDGLYVMLSVDNTKKNPADVKDGWDGSGTKGAFTVPGNGVNSGVEYTDRAIAIREGGKFDMIFNPHYAASYNLLVAVGELKDGVFTQTYPDARLVMKAGKKGSVKIKATGNYTLNPYVNSKVAISYNGNVKKAQFTNKTDPTDIDTTKNYAKNAIIGNKENKFRDYFIAQEGADGKIATIGLRDDITSEQLNALLANPKSEDLIGYISINNGDSFVDVKIKITLKTETKSLKAVCNTVLEGDQVVADVRLLDGKEAVKVTDYTIVSAEGGITRAQNRADYLTNKTVNESGVVVSGDIRLKADRLAAGKYKVSLKVTPENTPAINRADATRTTYEVPVDLIITVAKKDTKNKIVLGKGDNVWVVAKSDFVGPQGVENEPEEGSWQKEISYSFKNRLSIADDTKISVESDAKAPYISFVSDNYKVDSAAQKLTVVVDKKKLASAIDGKKLKWGGKVTATATFKYGTSGIKEDTVKLTITLPAQPAAELSDNKVFKDAESNIENMVATMYEHYTNVHYNAGDAAANSIKSEAIAKRIEERLYEVADGATVTVDVTYALQDGTKLASSYAATVSTKSKADFYTHTFSVRTEMTASGVRSAIIGYKNSNDTVDGVAYDLINWSFAGVDNAALKAELEALLAKEVTKDTTDAQYAAFIRQVLVKTGQITSNINISVETLEDGRKAPTSDAVGYYNVKVTITDRNVAPSLGARHSAEMNLRVTFGMLEDTSDALDDLNESTDPTERSMSYADNSAKVAAAAWKAVATPGMEYTDQKFRDELEKQLVAKANELILQGGTGTTGNEALKATGILDGTLQVTVNTTKDDANEGKLTKLAYTMLLSDTSGDKAVEKRINVNFTTATEAPEFQTMNQLTKKLTAANLTVKTVSEKAAAFAEIEKTIKEKLCTNPALDLTDLKVEDAATPKFTAPTPKYNGLVSVKISCTGMTATEVNNIVILKGENDFAGTGDTADEIALSKERNRIEAALQAELNSETLEKMYVEMQNAFAKDPSDTDLDPRTAVNVEKKITAIAEEIVGTEGKYVLDATADNAVGDKTQGSASQATLVAPTDSAAITLPAFEIKLTLKPAASEGGADTQADDPVVVTIPSMKISALDEFQNWTKAKDIFDKNMVNNLTGANALVIDYVALAKMTLPAANSPAGTDYTDGGENFGAIEGPVVTALKKASTKEITNPLFSIAIAKDTGAETTTTCKTHATYEYAIDNLQVTLTNNGVDDTTSVGHISVNVKKAADSEVAVTGVAFTRVKQLPIESGKGTSDNRIEINVDGGTPSSIMVEAEATMSKAPNTRGNAEFDWKVDDGANDSVAGAAIAGVSINNGNITIDKTVCGDENHEQLLRVTATAKTKGFGGEEMKKSIYLKLTFKPTVMITMDSANPKEIEIDATAGTNATGKTFKAALTGTNVRPDDAKTVLDWKLYDGTVEVPSRIATLTKASGNYGEVTVTFGSDASEYAVAGKQLTLEATILSGSQTKYTNGDAAKATCKFTVVKDTDTAKANRKITLTSATGVDSIADVTGAKKIVVTGTNVRIPLSVNDAKYGSRTWTYALEAVTTTATMAALGTDKYEEAAVEVGSTEESTKPIRIETSSDGKKSWLVITDVEGGIPDATKDAPAAQAVKITATSAATATGDVAVSASDLNVILVVKPSIETMKLYQVTESAGGGSGDGDTETESLSRALAVATGDDGEKELTVEKTGGTINLVAMLEGAHLTDAQKTGQIDEISYQITNKSKDVVARIDTENHKATLTITSGEATGSVTVTATYKSGTGENAVTMTATRIIKVVTP